MSVVFEEHFQLLSPKQQHIWQVIHHFCKKYRNAFPSHAKLAQLCGCCIRTVRYAIRKFTQFGWLETIKRCYRSCLFFIKEHLLNINPKDKRNYLRTDQGEGGGMASISRERLQHDLQHIKGIPRNTETLSDSKQPQKKKYWQPNKVIPEFIKIQGMPQEDWQKLANQFSERDLFEGLQETKSHSKLFGKPRNIAAFITAKCKKYIKNREKIREL